MRQHSWRNQHFLPCNDEVAFSSPSVALETWELFGTGRAPDEVVVAVQEIDAPDLAPAAGEQPMQAPAAAPVAAPVQAPHSAPKYAIFLVGNL